MKYNFENFSTESFIFYLVQNVKLEVNWLRAKAELGMSPLWPRDSRPLPRLGQPHVCRLSLTLDHSSASSATKRPPTHCSWDPPVFFLLPNRD
jgi:hypothetical protein